LRDLMVHTTSWT